MIAATRRNGKEWSEKSVAELQAAGALLVEDGNHGENRPRPDEFSTEGIQFIRAADMDSGRVLFESAQRINEVARQRVRKGIGAGGDVLLSHKGTVGKVAYVPLDAPPFVCSPQTTFWRVKDSKKLDRRYIYFFLLSRAFREQLDSRKGETDMADYVSLTTQRTLKVTIPPLAEQKAIAAVLGALDDKIELNRRMNATLEAMARALFQSWFVDFDPVRLRLSYGGQVRATPDNTAGLPAEALAKAGLDPATAALFPDSFQHCEAGHIPRILRPDLHASRRSVCSTEFMVVCSTMGVSREYLFSLFTSSAFASIYGTLVTGTTDSHQRIRPENVLEMKVVIPPPPLIQAFTAIAKPMFDRINRNTEQSRALATLRDTLLPKLLSREVRA